MSSISGAYAEPGLAVYGAAKAALLALAHSLNAEESAQGVMATAIGPAYVATDKSDWVTDRIPADFMITVDDVVSVVRTVLGLGRSATISQIVIARSGATGYQG